MNQRIDRTGCLAVAEGRATRVIGWLLQAGQWLLFLCMVGWTSAADGAGLRAGAFQVDISPTNFPVRVNAMFTERSADRVEDPLYAKAVAIESGRERVLICVVDTCMMTRELIDQAKVEVRRATGVDEGRMLVSATHTHSAPSAMGCLGSRVDPGYAAYLPGRIAAAMIGALERLVPAEVAWAQSDAWEHTFNRRWIRRPDRLLEDPFGQRSVRAHMHPGHESPDAVGPSGPVDPELSVLALRQRDGRPLAVLANYSQHYYGSPLLSSDYFGRFAGHLAGLLGAETGFVGLMSQGTSGDLMWMDYGAPRREIGYDAYAREMAERVAGMMRDLRWRRQVPLRMAQRIVPLGYRVPDAGRLAWARGVAAGLGERLPQKLPEIYALEAIQLHERPRTELIVQALRIGDLGIAALPNEVFALTGLKIKRASPLSATFNIELANGAEGYIPPPEQHRLGGYTTWPARTAGLEVGAEPRLVATALELLEEVTGQPARLPRPRVGRYARAVLRDGPLAYWRLEEMNPASFEDATGKGPRATIEGLAAWWLPGVDGRRGFQPPQPTVPNAFSGEEINRCVHLAGGHLEARVALAAEYSVEFWVWNGLPDDVRATTASLWSRSEAGGEWLGIAGAGESAGMLVLRSGSEGSVVARGTTRLEWRVWHHVVLVRQGPRIRTYLNGQPQPELDTELAPPLGPASPSLVRFGGGGTLDSSLEGKLDEVAVYDRALAPAEIAAHYRAAALVR